MTFVHVLIVWSVVSVLVGLVAAKFCAFNDSTPASSQVHGELIRG